LFYTCILSLYALACTTMLTSCCIRVFKNCISKIWRTENEALVLLLFLAKERMLNQTLILYTELKWMYTWKASNWNFLWSTFRVWSTLFYVYAFVS